MRAIADIIDGYIFYLLAYNLALEKGAGTLVVVSVSKKLKANTGVDATTWRLSKALFASHLPEPYDTCSVEVKNITAEMVDF